MPKDTEKQIQETEEELQKLKKIEALEKEIEEEKTKKNKGEKIKKEDMLDTKTGFWRGKIRTKEDALMVIKGSSNLFFILGGIDIALAILLLPQFLLDGIIYMILAYLLIKTKSPIVAVILLVNLAFAGFFLLAAAGGSGGGIVIVIMATWGSIRALQATLKLKEINKS